VTPAEWSNSVKLIAAGWRTSPLPAETAGLWYPVLARYSPAVFSLAIQNLLATRYRPPECAVLVTACEEAMEELAERARTRRVADSVRALGPGDHEPVPPPAEYEQAMLKLRMRRGPARIQPPHPPGETA
jgi:hypothetical protein